MTVIVESAGRSEYVPARPVRRKVVRNVVRVAHELQHTHACRFHLWGWTSPTEPPVDLGEQSLQIMDAYTMDLSKFIRIELIRMTGSIVRLSTDEGATS